MTFTKKKYINEITKQTFYVLPSACNLKEEILTVKEYNNKSIKTYLSRINLDETTSYFAKLGYTIYWTADDVNNLIESPSLGLCVESSEILNSKYRKCSFLSYNINGKKLIDILYKPKGYHYDLIEKEKKIRLREIIEFIYTKASMTNR